MRGAQPDRVANEPRPAVAVLAPMLEGAGVSAALVQHLDIDVETFEG